MSNPESGVPATSELPIPEATPGRRLSRRLLVTVGFVAFAAVGVALGLLRPDRLLVEHVVIDGAHRADASALRHLADVHNGATMWDVSLNGARKGLLRHPWVARATAERVWPDTVRLVVEEHVPVALLVQTNGLWYVDAEGNVFLAARGDDLDYPVVSGVDPALAKSDSQLGRVIVRDAIRLVDALDARGLVPRADVSEVAFDRDRGFLVHRRVGARIAFDFGRLDEQMDRLDILVHRQGVSLDQPLVIDLAPPTLAIVRPINGATG